MTKTAKYIGVTITSLLVIGGGVYGFSQLDNDNTASQTSISYESTASQEQNSLSETINRSTANSVSETETKDYAVDQIEEDYQTYTNELFPGFSFEYPTRAYVDMVVTKSEIYPEQNVFVLNVIDANEVVTFSLFPLEVIGCEVENPNVILVDTLPNGINIFQDGNSLTATTSSISYCPFNELAVSSIKYDNNSDYSKLNGVLDGTVEYTVQVNYGEKDLSNDMFIKVVSSLEY